MADDRTMADLAARGIALARIGIGVGASLAPGLVSRLQFGDTTPAQTVTVRMLGARDLALGLGALLAARRSSSGLRGWVEAGALADMVDALAFVRADDDAARSRGLTILAAAGAAAVGIWSARALTD